MKTKFETDTTGRVTMTYDDVITGERRSRTFSCPPDGGYVIEFFRPGESGQVCDALAHLGNTLSCSSRSNLVNLIRREYRAMRRFEKREGF